MRNLVVSIYMRCIQSGDHRMMGAKLPLNEEYVMPTALTA